MPLLPRYTATTSPSRESGLVRAQDIGALTQTGKESVLKAGGFGNAIQDIAGYAADIVVKRNRLDDDIALGNASQKTQEAWDEQDKAVENLDVKDGDMMLDLENLNANSVAKTEKYKGESFKAVDEQTAQIRSGLRNDRVRAEFDRWNARNTRARVLELDKAYRGKLNNYQTAELTRLANDAAVSGDLVTANSYIETMDKNELITPEQAGAFKLHFKKIADKNIEDAGAESALQNAITLHKMTGDPDAVAKSILDLPPKIRYKVRDEFNVYMGQVADESTRKVMESATNPNLSIDQQQSDLDEHRKNLSIATVTQVQEHINTRKKQEKQLNEIADPKVWGLQQKINNVGTIAEVGKIIQSVSDDADMTLEAKLSLINSAKEQGLKVQGDVGQYEARKSADKILDDLNAGAIDAPTATRGLDKLQLKLGSGLSGQYLTAINKLGDPSNPLRTPEGRFYFSAVDKLKAEGAFGDPKLPDTTLKVLQMQGEAIAFGATKHTPQEWQDFLKSQMKGSQSASYDPSPLILAMTPVEQKKFLDNRIEEQKGIVPRTVNYSKYNPLENQIISNMALGIDQKPNQDAIWTMRFVDKSIDDNSYNYLMGLTKKSYPMEIANGLRIASDDMKRAAFDNRNAPFTDKTPPVWSGAGFVGMYNTTTGIATDIDSDLLRQPYLINEKFAQHQKAVTMWVDENLAAGNKITPDDIRKMSYTLGLKFFKGAGAPNDRYEKFKTNAQVGDEMFIGDNRWQVTGIDKDGMPIMSPVKNNAN